MKICKRKVRGSSTRPFECGGGGAGGPVQEEKGGPVQNISDVGGREGAYGKGCYTLESLHLH
jgi:hypothetical protein